MISRRILPTVLACLFALAGLGPTPCTAKAQNATRSGPTVTGDASLMARCLSGARVPRSGAQRR